LNDVTREEMCLKIFGHGWRPLADGDDIDMAAKILAKNNDLGEYALPRNAADNAVIIAVDACFTADSAEDIVACNYSNVGIACFNPDLASDNINTSKGVGGNFYCDVAKIGLLDKKGNKWTDLKYNFNQCFQKRASTEKTKNIFMKAKGQLQLDCVNCKNKQTVQWSAVECDIGCRKDKKANKLKTTFRCEPVTNAAGKVIGARAVYDHLRFQEICGGGCTMESVTDHMGSTTKNLPTGKCGAKDPHTGNFMPLSKCHFNCDSGADASIKKKTNRIMACICKTESDARSCKWKIGNKEMDAKKWNGQFIQNSFTPGKCVP